MDDDFYPGIAESSYEDSRNPQVRKCGHEMAYDRVTGRCLFYGGRTDELGMQGNLSVELVLHRYVHGQLHFALQIDRARL